jgi:outer membrane lipoprotein-sorting protein
MTLQASETGDIDLRACPVLAQNVRLIGELPGSGFKSPQWLIERDSQFVQVSELLYKLAEQLNGERTLDEIAAALTESTEWIVDRQAVDQLIHEKLIPLALVRQSDSPSLQAPAPSTSPLGVNMRMRIIGPRALRPITYLFQRLYWPPVLLALVIAGVAAHWWLYRLHGVINGIRDTFYTPGGFPLVIALVFASAFFHEFGHASALRYGGGEARSMGLGFYLLYPAFYTDVTDGYRHGRWARVRVDLGGVYFHLVFCLGLFALTWATGKELFLFAVVLINLDMLRQFIPFVRLDGYWFLADLTGIPDFFSMMAPFLLSLRPSGKSAGVKLPQLKPWVRAVFGIYILATIPVLAYLFFLMIKSFPLLMAESWRGVLVQTHLLKGPGADAWTIVLVVLSIFFLVMPALGSVLFLAIAAAAGIRILYKWSAGATPRRAVAAAAVFSALAGIAWLWQAQLPQLRATLNIPLLANADKSDRLIATTQAATEKATTLKADVQGAIGPTPFSGRIVLKRPNLAKIEMVGGPDFGEFHVISDGNNTFTYFPHDQSLLVVKAAADGRNIQGYVTDHVESFFRPDLLKSRGAAAAEKQVEEEIVDGIKYGVIALRNTANGTSVYYRYYISPADNLVHRIVRIDDGKDGYAVSWCQLDHVRVNNALDNSSFAWSPPAGAKPLGLPAGVSIPVADLAKK